MLTLKSAESTVEFDPMRIIEQVRYCKMGIKIKYAIVEEQIGNVPVPS